MNTKIVPSSDKIDQTSISYNKCFSNANKENFVQTSNAYIADTKYQTKLPYTFDIFDKITDSFSTVENESVKQNAIIILNSLNKALVRISNSSKLSNYLSKLHVSKQEEDSVLIEWNFQDFRVGFIIEANFNESSYFIISEDKISGSFSAESNRIGSDYNDIMIKIINYTLRNT